MLSGQFRDRLRIGRRDRLCSSVSSPFGSWFGWLGLDTILILPSGREARSVLRVSHDPRLSGGGSCCTHEVMARAVNDDTTTKAQRKTPVTSAPQQSTGQGFAYPRGGGGGSRDTLTRTFGEGQTKIVPTRHREGGGRGPPTNHTP